MPMASLVVSGSLKFVLHLSPQLFAGVFVIHCMFHLLLSRCQEILKDIRVHRAHLFVLLLSVA